MLENQVTAEQLLTIIGKQTVTITMLENNIGTLAMENKKLKDAENKNEIKTKT